MRNELWEKNKYGVKSYIPRSLKGHMKVIHHFKESYISGKGVI